MGDVLDKKAPKSRSQEYRTLLAHSPYLVDYVKEFADYLAAYPKGRLEGAEDILYWTKDTFGLKPVLSAYHATLYRGPRGALVANKLLGATHYFNASLEIMAGIPTPDGKGLYLLICSVRGLTHPRACSRACSWERSVAGSRPVCART